MEITGPRTDKIGRLAAGLAIAYHLQGRPAGAYVTAYRESRPDLLAVGAAIIEAGPVRDGGATHAMGRGGASVDGCGVARRPAGFGGQPQRTPLGPFGMMKMRAGQPSRAQATMPVVVEPRRLA